MSDETVAFQQNAFQVNAFKAGLQVTGVSVSLEVGVVTVNTDSYWSNIVPNPNASFWVEISPLTPS